MKNYAPPHVSSLADRLSGPRSRAWDITEKGYRLEREGHEIIHLGVGDPDFDTPPAIVDAAIESLHSGRTHYSPIPGGVDLRQTIAKVTEDIEAMRFNTEIAALMEFTNAANTWSSLPHSIAEKLVLLLAPLAPHIAEELWQKLGYQDSLAYAPWPQSDARYLRNETLLIPVQVNGKMRGRIEVPADADEQQVLLLAKQDDNVIRHLAGKEIKREIYIRERIVNFVIGN